MRKQRAWVALVACCVLCPSPPSAHGQTAQPIGSVRPSGEVYVNDSLAAADQTLFAGDTLRTGAHGAAVVLIPSRGTLVVGTQSRVQFAAAIHYLAFLEQGSLVMQSLADASGFQVRVGDHVVVPVTGAEAAADVEQHPDGSARVVCEAGSVGILDLEGIETVFLNRGQSAQITATGEIQRAVPTPPEQPRQPPVRGGANKRLWVLLLVGGGVGGAVAALAGGGEKAQPVSPFQP